MNPLRAIARLFVVPCDERPESEPEYLPSQYSDFMEGTPGKKGFRAQKAVAKKHYSQITGEVIGYTLESGFYIVATDAMNRHSDAILGMMP